MALLKPCTCVRLERFEDATCERGRTIHYIIACAT